MHNKHWDCNELPPARARMLVRGPQGKPGEAGKQGKQGAEGKGAYEGAREAGYTGTEEQFYGELGSLKETVQEVKQAADAATTAKTEAVDAANAAATAANVASNYAGAAAKSQQAAEDAAAGVRDAINNIPEGTATPIVNDLTTGGTSMALSAEMGKQLKSEVDEVAGELDTRVNPNLLDNWYFGNPVNQRRQTEYAGTGYNIDRWQSNSGNVTKSIGENGVKLTAKASTYGWIFWQILKIPADAVGQTITGCLLATELIGTAWRFSVSFRNASDAEISSSTITVSSNLTIPSAVIPEGTVYIRVGVYVSSGAWLAVGDTITLRAAKLELGTQQTLAHQDANGNWVLNEIPDYNEQLLRCCMSTADSSDTYANNKVTPAAINAVPLDGSKAMTGALNFQMVNNGFARLQKNHSDSADYGTRLKDYDKNGNVLSVAIRAALGVVGVAGNDGVLKEFFHTGNKPSGSYTGNGSAASRTIETGGIGDVLIIYNSYNIGVITKYSAFVMATQGTSAGTIKTFKNPDLYFAGGVLYTNTDDTWVNGNGTVYNYLVP